MVFVPIAAPKGFVPEEPGRYYMMFIEVRPGWFRKKVLVHYGDVFIPDSAPQLLNGHTIMSVAPQPAANNELVEVNEHWRS